jgi:hypothetical protein
MRIEVVYCDNCGEPCWNSERGELRAHDEFPALPLNIESANEGESGTVCRRCQDNIDAYRDEEESASFAAARMNR